MRTAADRLEDCLQGSLVLMGIGNSWRRDDAAGPALIQRVAGRLRAHCIDAGSAPERHLGEAVRSAPDSIVLVDAVDFGGSPGETAAFLPGDLPERIGTTHDVPLALLMRYLEAESGATVLLVGIQPASTVFGVGISTEVEACVGSLASLFCARLGRPGGDDGDSVRTAAYAEEGGPGQPWT